jgi:uncharacterized repeat protein (TIGR02543 family)
LKTRPLIILLSIFLVTLTVTSLLALGLISQTVSADPGQWETLANAPATWGSNNGHRIEAMGNYVYFWQGDGGNGFYRYDPSDLSWHSLATAPFTSSYAVGMVAAKDSAGHPAIYIMGGTTSANSQKWYRYTEYNNSWSGQLNTSGHNITWSGSGTSQPKPANGSEFVWDNADTIYYFPGSGYSYNRYDWYKYTISTNTWTYIGEFNTSGDPKNGPGNSACLVTIGAEKYIYIQFGHTPSGNYTSAQFWRYQISNGQWTKEAQTGYGADDGADLVWDGGDNLFLFPGAYIEAGSGGCDEYRFLRYSISANTWAPLTEQPFNGSEQGNDDGGAAGIVGDYIYKLKGNDGNGDTTSTLFYRYQFRSSSTSTATATGPTGSTNNPSVSITYTYTPTPTSVKLYYTKDGGTSWSLAGEDTSVDGTFAYNITSGDGTYGWSAVAIGGGSTETDPPAGGTAPEAASLILDTVAPTVLNVTSTAANGSYTTGAVIPVTMQFSEAVTVVTTGGTPYITLETGTTDRNASYASGSGSATMTFNYTVQAGDTSSDLDYTSTTALALNGGTIKDAAGNSATLTLPTPDVAGSLGYNKDIVIDTTAPPAPTLVSLENGLNISDNTPTFEWTSVTDPSGVTYQIQIGNDANFSSLVYYAVDLVDNTHTLPDENALGMFMKYFWRVRAVDEVGNIGDWSEAWNFNYLIQWQVKFDQTGLDGTATGTIVTVNGFPLARENLPYTIWVDNGTVENYSYSSTVSSTVGGKQFRLDNVRRDNLTGTFSIPTTDQITVIGPENVTGNYVTQYKLTMATNAGTTTPTAGDNWHDEGTVLTISATAPSGYVWHGWTGTGTISYTGMNNPANNAVTMNSATTETAYWTHFSGSGSGTAGDPYIITTVEELQEMNDNKTAYYILGNDIDASATSGWNGGAGFVPIGWGPLHVSDNKFTGTFDGRRYKITNLHINLSGSPYVGLFGYVGGAVIENVGLEEENVIGGSYVGGLVGSNGDLFLSGGTIINCYSTGSVNGGGSTGGLVGLNCGTISRSYSAASVIGTNNEGGLVGNDAGPVSNCYATGSVSYQVINGVGGVDVGGLIGALGNTLSNCYSTGPVSGLDRVGGLVGNNTGGVYNCFWDNQTSGQSTSGGIPEWYHGTGKTTDNMKNVRTFTDNTWSTGLGTPWDFVGNPYGDLGNDNIWNIASDINSGYPFLAWQVSLVQYTLTMATNFGTTTPAVGNHTYNDGMVVDISATAPDAGPGEQYVFNGWTGTGTGAYTGSNNSAQVTMSSNITETASWTHQYQLTMATNFGTTNPAVGNTWYNAGTILTISATAPIPGAEEQYVWNGWTGTGTISYTGTNNPANNAVTMNCAITETASWTHQYTIAWTGTATFKLENLYKVNLHKDNLWLYQGLKLVVKFYEYDGITLQANSVIENNWIIPWHVVPENENVPQPRASERFSWGTVQIATLVLTTENENEVISTIANFTVYQSDLRGRYMAILRAWGNYPDQQGAFRAEAMDILRQWSSAPT